MPVFLLDEELVFPDPREANPEGLLAVGGDLSEDRLIMAYQKGIFPWYSEGDPILWWSPNPRCVIYVDEIKISKSMRNIMNRNKFEFSLDTCFAEVMMACKEIERNQEGTWIDEEMVAAYNKLHSFGVAHSLEVKMDGKLVGGLYGLSFGNMFFGESMFSRESNASKAGLIYLTKELKQRGFKIIDCQIHNDHLERLGAREIPRDEFLKELEDSMTKDSFLGSWSNW